MKRFFIIGIGPMTHAQTESLRDFIGGMGFGWWHWIDGMWLIVTDKADINATYIRDEIRKITPDAINLVVEVDPKDWVGIGPKSETRNMFQWLHTHWKK